MKNKKYFSVEDIAERFIKTFDGFKGDYEDLESKVCFDLHNEKYIESGAKAERVLENYTSEYINGKKQIIDYVLSDDRYADLDMNNPIVLANAFFNTLANDFYYNSDLGLTSYLNYDFGHDYTSVLENDYIDGEATEGKNNRAIKELKSFLVYLKLLDQKVAILDNDTDKLTDTVTVSDLLEGHNLYIGLSEENSDVCLYDKGLADYDYEIKLGSTLEECLHELGTFEEYFNNEDEGWYSDFMYFFSK